MGSVFSDLDRAEFKRSRKTLAVLTHQGDASMEVLDVKKIHSVVAMVPWKYALTRAEKLDPAKVAAATTKYFVCEKIGMEVAFWGERIEEDIGEGHNDEDEQAA